MTARTIGTLMRQLREMRHRRVPVTMVSPTMLETIHAIRAVNEAGAGLQKVELACCRIARALTNGDWSECGVADADTLITWATARDSHASTRGVG